jgi:excisionase family DNA binding protein
MTLIGVDGPAVLVSARITAILERYADLSALRVRTRGVDPEATQVLVNIRAAAMSWRGTATGTTVAAIEELAAGLELLSTAQAADLLGVSRRGIGQAITRRKLPATRVGRVWRVSREDVEHYRAARAV